MALPVSPPPRSDDVAVQGWSALTIRIAWILLTNDVKVRPAVLKDARTHVLYHLGRNASLPHAEDQATTLTTRFVHNARGRRCNDTWSVDAQMPLSPRWRRALDRSLSPVSELVFRKHYGDNRSLSALETQLQIDRVTLDGLLGGLREVVRHAATNDGVPLDQWSNARVDELLTRLAAWSPGPCPPLLDVIEGAHREHVTSCCRCDRTVRLVRASIVTIEELLPPTLGARPSGEVKVLALHFHPDARSHRRGLAADLPVTSYPIGDDLLLMDATRMDEIAVLLRTAAELGIPEAKHLRGAVVTGPGAWSRHGLLGPLTEVAEREARFRGWGQIDGMERLPDILPEPPSARRLGAAVAALALCTLVLVSLAFPAAKNPALFPIESSFTAGRGGIWTEFDVGEDAVITLVRLGENGLELVTQSHSPSDKAAYAVGDGSYRLHTPGGGVLVVSSENTVTDVTSLMNAADASENPLLVLSQLVKKSHPAADTQMFQR
jgi:hypothetical protein